MSFLVFTSGNQHIMFPTDKALVTITPDVTYVERLDQHGQDESMFEDVEKLEAFEDSVEAVKYLKSLQILESTASEPEPDKPLLDVVSGEPLCKVCRGAGSTDIDCTVLCLTCNGTGKEEAKTPCLLCGGDGKYFNGDDCETCSGTGKTPRPPASQIPESTDKPCIGCEGTGKIFNGDVCALCLHIEEDPNCSVCKGACKLEDGSPCNYCEGTGREDGVPF